jgi:hypothetical protein
MTASDETRKIPMYARDGSVRAWALVDEGDHASLSAHRWTLHPAGYAQRDGVPLAGKRQTVRMSRQVLGLESGDSRWVDHINGDRLDNRRANLRIATVAENNQNVHVATGASRFRGVQWNAEKQRWRARVKVNRKVIYCGSHRDEIDAAIAAQACRDEHMPFAQPDPALLEALAARKAAA